MEVTTQPLSSDQLAAIRVLLDSRAIEPVAVDVEKASAFLLKARIKCDDIANAQHHENRFDLGYGACHDVGEALLSAYGYRTRAGAGQHATVGRFMAIVLDQPPGSLASRRFDRLRRIRNAQDYRAQAVSQTEAELAAQSALQLIESAEVRAIS